jgi:hypothetical protein
VNVAIFLANLKDHASFPYESPGALNVGLADGGRRGLAALMGDGLIGGGDASEKDGSGGICPFKPGCLPPAAFRGQVHRRSSNFQ